MGRLCNWAGIVVLVIGVGATGAVILQETLGRERADPWVLGVIVPVVMIAFVYVWRRGALAWK